MERQISSSNVQAGRQRIYVEQARMRDVEASSIRVIYYERREQCNQSFYIILLLAYVFVRGPRPKGKQLGQPMVIFNETSN